MMKTKSKNTKRRYRRRYSLERWRRKLSRSLIKELKFLTKILQIQVIFLTFIHYFTRNILNLVEDTDSETDSEDTIDEVLQTEYSNYKSKMVETCTKQFTSKIELNQANEPLLYTKTSYQINVKPLKCLQKNIFTYYPEFEGQIYHLSDSFRVDNDFDFFEDKNQVDLYVQSVIKDIIGGSPLQKSNFFGKKIGFESKKLDHLKSILSEVLQAIPPVNYDGVIDQFQLSNRLSKKLDPGTPTLIKILNDVTEDIIMMERHKIKSKIAQKLHNITSQIRLYKEENLRFFNPKFLTLVLTTIYIRIVYTNLKTNKIQIGEKGRPTINHNRRIFFLQILEIFDQFDLSIEDPKNIDYNPLYRRFTLVDIIERNLEKIFVLEKLKISDESQYQELVYSDLDFIEGYRNIEQEIKNGTTDSEIRNLEKPPKINYYGLRNIKWSQNRGVDKDSTISSSLTLFFPGFVDNRTDIQDHLSKYVGYYQLREVKAVFWDGCTVQDYFWDNLKEISESISQISDVKAATNFIPSIFDSFDKLTNFDAKMLQEGIKHLLSAFQGVSAYFQKYNMINLCYNLFNSCYDYYWDCYHEGIKIGKAQGYMIAQLGSFDKKPLNLEGYSLGSLIAYYSATTVYDLIHNNSSKGSKDVIQESTIEDVTLYASQISKTEFLDQVYKLIGKNGSVNGKLRIVFSEQDLVLVMLGGLRFMRDRSLSDSIGHSGITYKEIVDTMIRQKHILKRERITFMTFLKTKVQIVDLSRMGMRHLQYLNRMDEILLR